MNSIHTTLEDRILILDGALGTMVQKYGLQESDYRTNELKNHTIELKGNTDILNLSRPELIRDIHTQYLDAGADIISTNTFGGNAISQADYETDSMVWPINYRGAQLAREAVDRAMQKDPAKPRFVAGAMGPTTKLASMSPNPTDPGYRSVHFDQLVSAYTEQANALLEGGIDLFLLETITDTLNAKAALFALMQIFEETGKEYPIMVSGTITDASGRILSGQTVEAFLVSISHAPLLSVGLNCALGANELRPYIETLSKECPFYTSAHPNAGLPNQLGEYDQTADEFANLVYEFANKGWLNIIGGCCGTTPAHIEAVQKAIQGLKPRKIIPTANEEIKTTDETTAALIDKWYNMISLEDKPTFSLMELKDLVSKVEDKMQLLKIKSQFDKERKFYHPEQVMFLEAHIFGRFQYLKISKN